MHELIEHKVLDSTTATVTFSNIPDIYEDLLLVASGRTTYTSTLDSNMRLRFNNDATASYIVEAAYGNGASGAQFRNTYDHIYGGFVPSAISTASTFSSSKIKISNYAKNITKEVSIENVHENNASTAYIGLIHAWWNKTTPITEIDIYTNNNPYVQHSSFTLYGVGRRQGIGRAPLAVGGYTTYDNGYWIHSFYGSGSFTPFVDMDVEYLVVAGGGGGGSLRGGGGGAGGYRSSVVGELSGGNSSAESKLSLTASTNYSVVVGAGGTGGTSRSDLGNSGANSSFATITSNGGGGGGSNNVSAALSGGSGGGSVNGGTGGSGTSGQGFAGKPGGGSGSSQSAGGGGGASSEGGLGVANLSGNGGSGLLSSITGTSAFYSGGGGGGAENTTAGAGGIGGGGDGTITNTVGEAGLMGTGGGGGGSGWAGSGTEAAGGAGGSGIVIVRYRA